MPDYKKAYVTVMVDDLDKSVEFYGSLLGLYEDLRFGDSWAEMTTKGITIGLHPKKIGARPNYGASANSGSSAGRNQTASLDLKVEGQVAPHGTSSSSSSSASASASVSSSTSAGHDQKSFFSLKVEGKVAHPAPPQLSIGFEVEDICKTAKELEAKGIRFHFQENDVNILAFFVDPDGTPLYLTQVR